MGQSLSLADVDDFKIRLDLPGGFRLYGLGPEDGGCPTVFVPPDEVLPTDLPVYVPARKSINEFTIAPCLRPSDQFLPLMEGK